MSNYGPNVKIARLYKKTSAKGNDYFTGRIGMAKVAMMKSRETADDGGEIWEIVLSPGPESNSRRQTDTRADAMSDTNGLNGNYAVREARPVGTKVPISDEAFDGPDGDIPF